MPDLRMRMTEAVRILHELVTLSPAAFDWPVISEAVPVHNMIAMIDGMDARLACVASAGGRCIVGSIAARDQQSFSLPPLSL